MRTDRRTSTRSWSHISTAASASELSSWPTGLSREPSAPLEGVIPATISGVDFGRGAGLQHLQCCSCKACHEVFCRCYRHNFLLVTARKRLQHLAVTKLGGLLKKAFSPVPGRLRGFCDLLLLEARWFCPFYFDHKIPSACGAATLLQKQQLRAARPYARYERSVSYWSDYGCKPLNVRQT